MSRRRHLQAANIANSTRIDSPHNTYLQMAGFKRGGARGGSGSGFKKASAKKRAGSDDEDSAPRASKKSKGDDDESEPFVPELKTDDDNKPFVAVRMRHEVRLQATLTGSKLNASGKRRITVNEFKGNSLIDIREFYVTDAGETKPGKKVKTSYVFEAYGC
jgi:hypothetical protein